MHSNDGFDYTMRIGVEAEGEALLGYLARRFDHSPRAEWEGRIAAGLVLLDFAPATSDSVLRRGQVLVWRRPPWEEPSAPLAFDVLAEDDDVVAVAKPAGLPTLPGAGFLETTLLHLVRLHAPGAAPVHRLGRWTSGVVLFGRTPGARAELSRQWAAGGIDKRYRALAAGDPGQDAFTITQPIGPVPHPLLGSVHAASATGKPAISRIEVLERRAGVFLCDVEIATGRPHQIRIHVAAAGHPLVGDPLYPAGGVPEACATAVPGDPGYHLHAAEIRFRHPRDGAHVAISCEPPPLLRPSGAQPPG
jgi:23S rRNA pseudouridine1911/1915/1917 synthase